MREWSFSQQKVFEAIKHPTGHVGVQATAGGGKTTTILEALNYIPKFKRSIFLSFSSGIINELKDKVPVGIQALTLHALGFGFLNKKHKLVLDEDKYFKKALYFFKGAERDKQLFINCYRIQDICSFIRMTLTKPETQSVIEMCNYYNVDYTYELIETSIAILSQKEELMKSVDFVDMVYLPASNPQKYILSKFDYIFLDEAQDLNQCQYQFIQNLLSSSGRLIFVGDEYQCIYGFMGSDVRILKQLQSIEGTVNLTLPISYRCPVSVVEKAKTICPLITPNPLAEQGVVREGSWREIVKGDLVLSRYTKPLISLYLKLLDSGISAVVVGKDFEKGLLLLAEKCYYPAEIMIRANLKSHLHKVVEELSSIGVKKPTYHVKYITQLEKVQILEMILDRCIHPKDFIEKVKLLFTDTKGAIKLMTLHRSKGLESDRVFIITKFNRKRLMPSEYAYQEWEHEQERNLEFVGYTRAKKEMIFIEIEDGQEE